LENPVVPDVYWIWAISPGVTWGSLWVGDPEAIRPDQDDSGMISRRRGQAGTDLFDRRQQVPAAVFRLHDQPDRLRPGQDILQLLGQICGIDRHQRDARQRRAELDQHPFRAVRGPYGNVFTGGEASQQGTRDLFGIFQKGCEAPPPAWVGIRGPFNQSGALAPSGDGAAQGIANRLFEHRFRPIGRPIGGG
jgi:hypothetical protein